MLMLLVFPLVMIACDEEKEERRNPVCPNSSSIQLENNSGNLVDNTVCLSRLNC